jgi:hypothetical protein
MILRISAAWTFLTVLSAAIAPATAQAPRGESAWLSREDEGAAEAQERLDQAWSFLAGTSSS